MRFRALGFAGLLTLFSFALLSCRPPETRAPLAHEAYVWQRAHTENVSAAVRAHAPDFTRLVVLAAEVSWKGDRPQIVRIPLAHDALREASPLGLALRVNTHAGTFAPDSPATRELVALARSLLAETHTAGLRVDEFQVDYDAPERRLADYRQLLLALRPAVSPARLTFTALPAWLKHRMDFAALAASADSYVLQVHSLARPASPDSPVSLCDPTEARRAIAAAARFDRPFRVALPTYAYRLAFDSRGRFFALSAEGPQPAWPPDTTVRELSADPATLAPLVAELARSRPSALTGILWYRLPVAGDRLNWTWPTLASVMRGETPAARVTVEARTDPTGLVELFAVNSGNADHSAPLDTTVRWTDAALLASDTLPPFRSGASDRDEHHLAAPSVLLRPGSRQLVAWLRFDRPPTTLHVSPPP